MAKKIGTCQCEFSGLRQDFVTGNMEMVLRIPNDFESKQKAKLIADQAANIEKLTISLEKYAEKRTIDANAYFWTLAGKLSAILNIPSIEIYREYIKGIGDNFEIVPIRNDAKKRWMDNWSSKGMGWICEDLGEGKIPDYSNIICYYGSSTYDSHQMYRLTELLIFDCKEQGIETLPPHKVELMMNEWAEKQAC